MREFSSIAGFVEHLAVMAAAQAAADLRALERASAYVEKEAKAKIGEYQAAAGPFVAWAELADATKADRERLGYPENEPLLREGDLRDSIQHQVEVPDAFIGSNDPIAEYQELGTEHIPPRSFLGSTGVETADKVVEIVGRETFIALAGQQVFQGAIPLRGENEPL